MRGSSYCTFVADEAQLAEQVIVQRHDPRVAIGIDPRRRVAGTIGRGRDAPLRLAAEGVELVEVRAGVERRVLDARDHQRGDREVGIGAERGVREAPDEMGL